MIRSKSAKIVTEGSGLIETHFWMLDLYQLNKKNMRSKNILPKDIKISEYKPEAIVSRWPSNWRIEGYPPGSNKDLNLSKSEDNLDSSKTNKFLDKVSTNLTASNTQGQL